MEVLNEEAINTKFPSQRLMQRIIPFEARFPASACLMPYANHLSIHCTISNQHHTRTLGLVFWIDNIYRERPFFNHFFIPCVSLQTPLARYLAFLQRMAIFALLASHLVPFLPQFLRSI